MKDLESELERSPSQKEWEVLANKVREKLDIKIERIPDMNGCECLDIVRALKEALAFEIASRTYDEGVEKGRQTWSNNT